MVAEFKSHVLARDEKGFVGIPFKRLLLAGVGGGLVYTLGKIAFPEWAIPAAIVAGVLFIFFSALQGGIPRWQRMLYQIRGNLMLTAAHSPQSLSGNAAKLLELPAELVKLDAASLFAPPLEMGEANLAEWVTFAQSRDADHDDGLMFLDSPLEAK